MNQAQSFFNCGKPISLAEAPAAGGSSSSSDSVRKKTNKKKIAVIVVLTLLVFFGELYALGSIVESMDGTNLNRGISSTTSQTQSQPQ